MRGRALERGGKRGGTTWSDSLFSSVMTALPHCLRHQKYNHTDAGAGAVTKVKFLDTETCLSLSHTRTHTLSFSHCSYLALLSVGGITCPSHLARMGKQLAGKTPCLLTLPPLDAPFLFAVFIWTLFVSPPPPLFFIYFYFFGPYSITPHRQKPKQCTCQKIIVLSGASKSFASPCKVIPDSGPVIFSC